MFELKQSFAAAFVALLVGCFSGGCDLVVAHPWVYTEVTQEKGEIIFKFFIQEKSWWSGTLKKVPYEVSIVMVGNSTGVIWEVRGEAAHRAVRVTFGIVPEGFVQTTPKAGVPASLVKGAEYDVLARSSGSGVTRFLRE